MPTEAGWLLPFAVVLAVGIYVVVADLISERKHQRRMRALQKRCDVLDRALGRKIEE